MRRNEIIFLAKKAADAHEKYNSVLQQNGDLINKANAKMRDIISSLQEQLMKINGSKYDEDIASARKSFMSTQKNIAESKTTLKSIKPSVLALASRKTRSGAWSRKTA